MSDVINMPPPQAATQTEAKTSAHGSFIWYELITPDPVSAATFYEAVVPGWSFGEQLPGEMGYRMINRSDGGMAGGVLRLSDDMRQNGVRPVWLGYVAVDDVDASVASIEQAGGKTLMPATDIPDVGRIAMVADPQGVPFYVMKPTPPAGNEEKVSDVFSLDQPGRMSWNELATRDQRAALLFYSAQFGWAKGDTMPMGEMGDYQLITHNGAPLGAIMTAAAENPPRWRFYIRVTDVDAAAQTVRANGGNIVHGPAEVPGGERILIGSDPQGTEFALVGK
jgi:predicted enzyme related to lactoylglutathione lyase